LYHLARLGWTDTLLVEKGELTCGSTWHAAGLCTQFHSSRPMTKLLMRSLEIYGALTGPSGLPVDMRTVGSVRLATTPERVDEVRARQGLALTLGLPYEVIGADEVSDLFPLADVDDVLAAAYLPTDGYVDPTAVTQAFAHSAREAGAAISQRTKVTGFTRSKDGWIVHTDRGDVECEHVVNCAGMWARQVGALAGARLPIVPLEHHYVVTEGIDAVRDLESELPVLRDPEASFYVRGEGDALLVGPFEFTPKSWSEHRVPEDFEGRLLPANLERIMPVLLDAAKRVPALEDAGLKTLLNGPDGYTPDGLCLMGEVAGLPGFHVLAGFSIFGIVFGGGAGEYLAQWIVNGQPDECMWDVDVRRFGPYADSYAHRVPRALETYAREYKTHHEDEETLAGRPLKTDPLYDVLARRGAVFGSRFGWERPLWFSGPGEPVADEPSLRIPDWHGPVGRECKAVRAGVGVLDQSSFAKFALSGPGAEQGLAGLCANRLPAEAGRISLTQMLNEAGGIECDVTVARVAPDTFYIVSAAACEEHDLAWIEENLRPEGAVDVRNVTARYGVLTVAGPKSRELLSRLTDFDLSKQGLPFFRHARMEIAGVMTRVMRLSYVGELGFELHHPVEYSRVLYNALLAAGEEFGLVDFGYRALESMRLEKGYRLWGKDILPTHTPIEAGFDRLIDWDHEFIGRDALFASREGGPERLLVSLALDPDRRDAYPHQYDPIYRGEKVVGHVAAGGFGHTLQRPVALAYLPTEIAVSGGQVDVAILGERTTAAVSCEPLFDSEDKRLRA
jgi:4-methylaminobutanoate oxidase (formaldehyde-forming)